MCVRSRGFFEAILDIEHILPELKAEELIHIVLVGKDSICQCVEKCQITEALCLFGQNSLVNLDHDEVILISELLRMESWSFHQNLTNFLILLLIQVPTRENISYLCLLLLYVPFRLLSPLISCFSLQFPPFVLFEDKTSFLNLIKEVNKQFH